VVGNGTSLFSHARKKSVSDSRLPFNPRRGRALIPSMSFGTAGTPDPLFVKPYAFTTNGRDRKTPRHRAI
jgi:hypothetical protein